MLGQFSDDSIQKNARNYHPKLLKTKADISFFNDVLDDLDMLDALKKAASKKLIENNGKPIEL